jgi:hypothetical protein
MSDVASLIVLISHPDIDPNSISTRLGLKPTLMQKAGEQVITPRGKKVGSRYAVSKWQYIKQLGIDSDWWKELDPLLGELSQHSDFFHRIDAEGGKTLIYFTATDFPRAVLEVEPALLSLMAEIKISFGFEFITTPSETTNEIGSE